MKEHWQPIPGFEDHYEVSDIGRVRSLERQVVSHADKRVRTFKGRILKQHLEHGYPLVGLSKDGIVSRHYVHRLILTAFIGPAPDGAECCHNNGVRDDNRLDNLRWDTHRGNVRDCIDHGRFINPIAAENRGKTHCYRGHSLDETNTIVYRGSRSCRECRRINERARYHRAKQQHR